MAVIDKGINGRYRLSVYVEYEIKNTGILQYSVTLSEREIRKRIKYIKKLTKLLIRMKKHGFDIKEIEVGVDE